MEQKCSVVVFGVGKRAERNCPCVLKKKSEKKKKQFRKLDMKKGFPKKCLK